MTAALLFGAGSSAAWADHAQDSSQARGEGQVAQVTASGQVISPEQATAPRDVWRVVTLEGVAHVLEDDGRSIGWKPLRRGQTFLGDAQIETGVDSQLLLFNGRDTVTVRAETRMVLLKPSPEVDRVEIYQDQGSADYHVQSRSPGLSLSGLLTKISQVFGGDAQEDGFEVRAPYLTTVVKGTAFTVTVQRSHTEVGVSEGVVMVLDARTGHQARIVAGQHASAGVNTAAGVAVGDTTDDDDGFHHTNDYADDGDAYRVPGGQGVQGGQAAQGGQGAQGGFGYGHGGFGHGHGGHGHGHGGFGGFGR